MNAKVHLCMSQPNLNVILCAVETEEEWDNEILRSVADLQVKKGLMSMKKEDLDHVAISCEPVWAIREGKEVTPDQVQITHIVVCQTLA